jgi:hypothetical protein
MIRAKEKKKKKSVGLTFYLKLPGFKKSLQCVQLNHLGQLQLGRRLKFHSTH